MDWGAPQVDEGGLIMTGFKVQSRSCDTCIYRKDMKFDLEKLENDVRDQHMGFNGHRICHHSTDVCCRGFWNAHKNEFPAGQIAQRLGIVEYVNVDTLKKPQRNTAK